MHSEETRKKISEATKGRDPPNRGPSFKYSNPDIFAEYDTVLNSHLDIEKISRWSKQKVWWVCPGNPDHSYESDVGNRCTHRSRCPFCFSKRASSVNNLAVKFPNVAAELVIKEGEATAENILPFSNKSRTWQCPKGHIFEMTPNTRTVQGQGCPNCSLVHTKLEKFGELILNLERFNRKPHPKLNYRPDIKASDTLFIDVDGLFWHSEKGLSHRPKLKCVRTYHRNKRRNFENKGLRILQFYEDEVMGKSEIVASMVNAISGKISTRIFARKLQVETVKREEAVEFLQKNHIIGKSNSFNSHLGLRSVDGVLQQLITYQIRNKVADIVRSCGRLNTVVVGGFQRLLKALIDLERPTKVKTLVDLRYADGHSLVKAGFLPTKEYIQYQYTDGFIRKDKRAFRVPAGINEKEAAAMQGWYRIFDAGRRGYVLEIT